MERVNGPVGGRRLVIGDIHGCLDTLVNLLDLVSLTKSDKLILLGDLIDKGPNSAGVIQLVSGLIRDGYHVVALRGNHEEIFLRLVKGEKDFIRQYGTLVESCVRMKATDLLRNGKAIAEYVEFMESMKYIHEEVGYIFVHAGINISDLTDVGTMVGLDEDVVVRPIIDGKILVCGHTPTHIEEIKTSINRGSEVICLDNGVVKSHAGMGNLLCWDIDNRRLYTQRRID